VAANHTIAASFEINTFTITASAGENGSITPSGAISVNYGADQAFTITPSTGYHVADVLVDGISVGALTSYTFTNVQAGHSIVASFAIDTFTITASAGTGGTIDPSGAISVDYGADQAFTITPSTGYYVADVLVDGASVGAVTTYTFDDVAGNHTIATSFAINTFTLSYAAGEGGSLTGEVSQVVDYGAGGTPVTAVANTGYHFVSWSDGVLTATRTDSNVMSNVSVTANFALNEYTLTVVSVHGTVTKTPDQATYHYGDAVTLSMAAENGWTFAGWSPELTDNQVTILGDTTVTAAFTQDEYTLTVVSEHGTVTMDPDQATYHYGDTVQLIAAGDTGWSFVNWTGDLESSTNPVAVTIHGDTTITANYAQNQYALTVDVIGSGTVGRSPDAATYAHGTLVLLTPQAEVGYTFSGWSGSDAGALVNNGDGTWGLVMDAARSVTATFTQNAYNLTVDVGTGGSVSKDPDWTTYPHGTSVLLTATAEPGYTFAGWTGGGCSGNELTCTVVMDDDKSVVAAFTQNQYTLAVDIVPSGSGTVDRSPDNATYTYGQSVTLTATPNPGYAFEGWSGAGCSGTGDCVVTITDNTSVTANFVQTFTLDITIIGQGSVDRNPDKSVYIAGETVILTPQPAPGWTFFGWIGDLTGSASPVSVIMDGDKAITAMFDPPAGACDAATLINGILSANASYPTQVSVTLPPQCLYVLDAELPQITGDLIIHGVGSTITRSGSGTPFHYFDVSSQGSLTVKNLIVGDGYAPAAPAGEGGTSSLPAPAAPDTGDIQLTITLVGNGNVSQSNPGPFLPGDAVELTATPDEGWVFAGWSGDLTGSDNPASILMDASKSVTATFTQVTAVRDILKSITNARVNKGIPTQDFTTYILQGMGISTVDVRWVADRFQMILDQWIQAGAPLITARTAHPVQ
jgi:uncharacterized repeat protein (TIGR02543 family)